MIAIAAAAVTYQQINVAVSGFTAGYSNVDVQYSTRPDFRFALAPIIFNQAPSSGIVSLAGLNQRTTYFIRMRERSGSNVGSWTDPISAYTPSNTTPSTNIVGATKAPAMIVVPETVMTWSGDSEVPGYPAANLATDGPTDQWWSDSSTGYALEMVHSGAPIDTIALLETNASPLQTIRVKAGTSYAQVRGSSPLFSTSAQQLHASPDMGGRSAYHALVRLASPQAYTHWRLEIANPATLGRFVASYACLGLARTSGKNMADDSAETSVDLGSLDRLRDGAPDRVTGFMRSRKVEFDMAFMSEAAWETQFSGVRSILGSNLPALVLPNSKPGVFLHDRILFGPVGLKMVHPKSRFFTLSLSVASQI